MKKASFNEVESPLVLTVGEFTRAVIIYKFKVDKLI